MSTSAFDRQRFREVLGNYPTGVTVVTAVAEDGTPAGMAVGSFTSVSLDPPLVAFLPDKSSSSFPRIRTATSFCVNVLAADQEPVCRAFATRGGDKFAGITWSTTPSGAPRIDDVAAWLDCEFDSITEAGDHWLVLGRVRDLDSGGSKLPLVFFQGGYGRFSPLSLVAVPEADFIGHLRLADLARAEMERVTQQLGVECIAVAAVDEQLVVLASAGSPRGGGGTFSRVGQRIPFVPPMGTLLVAWGDAAEADAWLARTSPPSDESHRRRHLEQLDRVRARGWSMSLGDEVHSEFQRAVDRYSDGQDSRERVQRLAGRLADQFEPPDLDPAGHHDVRLVSAPVFAPDGSVPLMLTLWGLPRPSTVADVDRYVTALRDAAEAVTKSIAG